MLKQKVTKCPSPVYQPYVPDRAMRLAQEKAAKDQPPLIGIASKIPADYSARLDRREVK